jgi:hypothetical protein
LLVAALAQVVDVELSGREAFRCCEIPALQSYLGQDSQRVQRLATEVFPPGLRPFFVLGAVVKVEVGQEVAAVEPHRFFKYLCALLAKEQVQMIVTMGCGEKVFEPASVHLDGGARIQLDVLPVGDNQMYVAVVVAAHREQDLAQVIEDLAQV